MAHKLGYQPKIMKALILTLSIASCLSVAKAQQFQMPANGKILPEAKVPKWQKSFNDSMLLSKPKSRRLTAMVPGGKLRAVVYADRMPVMEPANTDKKMPVVKTDKTDYKMPIAGKGDSTSNIIATPDDRKKPQ